MFSRAVCDCCGRRFFGTGIRLSRLGNVAITVCGDRCAASEGQRYAAELVATNGRRAAERSAWASDVRRSIAAGGWHQITIRDTPPRPGTIARFGGLPVGITARSWPARDGQLALHVCTLPGAALGIDAAALAVFLHVTNEYAPDLSFAGSSALIALSAADVVRGEPGDVPPNAPLHHLRPSAVNLDAPAAAWDPTVKDAPNRSYIGSVPTSFEGESMDGRFDHESTARGRFLFQVDGEALPWAADREETDQISGLYVYEGGAFLDAYG